MLQLILTIIGLIIALFGVICIFDARILTKKWFGFGDQNDGSAGLKMVGFVFTIAGFFTVFFNI